MYQAEKRLQGRPSLDEMGVEIQIYFQKTELSSIGDTN